MPEMKYVSKVKVEPVEGKFRCVQVSAEDEAILFGVRTHSEVAEHYGVSPGEEELHATTLDYLVVSAGPWRRPHHSHRVPGNIDADRTCRPSPPGESLRVIESPTTCSSRPLTINETSWTTTEGPASNG